MKASKVEREIATRVSLKIGVGERSAILLCGVLFAFVFGCPLVYFAPGVLCRLCFVVFAAGEDSLHDACITGHVLQVCFQMQLVLLLSCATEFHSFVKMSSFA